MTKPPHDSVAGRLKVEARNRKVSQAELGTAAGLTQAAVSRRLVGEVEITVTEAERFADALGVSVAWLFGETAEKAPAAPTC